MSSARALRLFVALELPAEAVGELARFAGTVDAAVWRPVPPDSLHVTLAFLGATDAALAPAAAGAVSSACEGAVAPCLRLGAPLLLPARRPRVLSASLVDADGALGELQASVATELVAARVYEPEARRFRPHVTVARLRPRMRAPREAADLELEPLGFRGAAVTLFSSHTSSSGARYEALARVELEGGRTAD